MGAVVSSDPCCLNCWLLALLIIGSTPVFSISYYALILTIYSIVQLILRSGVNLIISTIKSSAYVPCRSLATLRQVGARSWQCPHRGLQQLMNQMSWLSITLNTTNIPFRQQYLYWIDSYLDIQILISEQFFLYMILFSSLLRIYEKHVGA